MKTPKKTSTATVAITNVRIPAHVRDALTAAAAREHRSLANYLIVAGMDRLAKSGSQPAA